MGSMQRTQIARCALIRERTHRSLAACSQSSPCYGKPIQVGSKLALAAQLANCECRAMLHISAKLLLHVCQRALVNFIIDFLSGHGNMRVLH